MQKPKETLGTATGHKNKTPPFHNRKNFFGFPNLTYDTLQEPKWKGKKNENPLTQESYELWAPNDAPPSVNAIHHIFGHSLQGTNKNLEETPRAVFQGRERRELMNFIYYRSLHRFLAVEGDVSEALGSLCGHDLGDVNIDDTPIAGEMALQNFLGDLCGHARFHEDSVPLPHHPRRETKTKTKNK